MLPAHFAACEDFDPRLSDASLLQTSVFRFGQDGRLLYRNGAALALFPNISLGLSTEDFIVALERNGMIDGIAASALSSAINARLSQHLLQLTGARTLFLAISEPANGGLSLEATDITDVVAGELGSGVNVVSGLPSRNRLLEALTANFTPGTRATQSPTALLYIALDTSGMVASSFDQDMIGSVFRLAATRIRKCLDDTESLFSCGNGIAVVQSSKTQQPVAAESLANRLIDLLERSYLIDGQVHRIRVRAGISFLSAEVASREQLVSNAMLAAGRASAADGSNPLIYSEAMIEEANKRRDLETALRRALVLGEFWLAYQPQYEIDGRRLVGFEALVRWSDPERGLISPADFIPLAEETDLIQELGEWVLKTACKEAASWPPSLTVSVNLSPLQMKNARIVDIVATAMLDAGLNPARLDLEITENALIGDAVKARSILDQLSKLGVKVSIDDFGTGYSSLSYLQNFHFDKIKIDQSFVRNVEHNEDSLAIVQAVIALAKALGINTIAEGVETERQLQIIARAGCAQVQGYLTGRPVPSAELPSLFPTF